MPDITDLPVMSLTDAVSLGVAGYKDVPHKPIDVPDGAFTIATKTTDGRRVSFCFLSDSYDGPARFVVIRFHDRGTTIANPNNVVSPTFNAFALTSDGRDVMDSRPLEEAQKPSILVLLMDEAAAEPPVSPRDHCPMDEIALAELLGRAASVITAPAGVIPSDRERLIDTLHAEAANRRSRAPVT
jgi:hypothetical protein